MTSQDYRVPPTAAKIKNLIEARLADARAHGGPQETATVEWNSRPLHVTVIELPIQDLYYNPLTRRVRAQRTLDAKRDQALTAEPFTPHSQAYLEHLLQADPADPFRRDPAFDKLKNELYEFGQSSPGLVTYQGILIDGNTRCAAMRMLGAQVIRVGVLPESFMASDLAAVEMALQLREDARRDYSYVNRILAMAEQVGLRRPTSLIAKDFRTTVNVVKQDLWVLAQIQEVIRRSTLPDGRGALRLVDFEDRAERMRDLYKAWHTMQAKNANEAEAIKELRLAAIVLGIKTVAVRTIDRAQFRQVYLDKRLKPEYQTVEAEQTEAIVPGLGISLPVTHPTAFVDRILRAGATLQGSGDEFSDERTLAAKEWVAYKEAFDLATDDAMRDRRVKKRAQAAAARIDEVTALISQCGADVSNARATRSQDEEALDEALLRLKAGMRQFALFCARTRIEPGPGLQWLIDLAAMSK